MHIGHTQPCDVIHAATNPTPSCVKHAKYKRVFVLFFVLLFCFVFFRYLRGLAILSGTGDTILKVSKLPLRKESCIVSPARQSGALNKSCRKRLFSSTTGRGSIT